MNDSLILLRLPTSIAEKVSVLFDHQQIVDGDVIDTRIQAGGGVAAHGGYLPADVGGAIRTVLPDIKDTVPLEAALSLWGDDLRVRDAGELARTGDLLGFDEDATPRLTRRLAIERANAAAGWAAASAIEYRCVGAPHEYAFRVHNEEFHATLTKMPTAVEAHRGTKDLRCLYMVGDVREELVVHDVPLSRPRPSYVDVPEDGVGVSGVTPLMLNAKMDRLRIASPEARRMAIGVASLSDVQLADEALHEYKALLAQKAAASIALSKKSGMTTEFTYERVVDAPAWMDHLPTDFNSSTALSASAPVLTLVLSPSNDPDDPLSFRASAMDAQEAARKHFKREELKRQQRKAAIDAIAAAAPIPFVLPTPSAMRGSTANPWATGRKW